jgi:methyl-accepting chemotaxis protein
MLKVKLNVSGAIALLGAVIATGVVISAAIGTYTLYNVRIGGPAYARIIEGKDLLADVLPPPEYVIEAYLDATLAYQGRLTPDQAKQNIAKLRKDYDDRHDYWQKSDLPTDLKTKLTDESSAKVAKFWDAVENQMLPALAHGDKAQAAKAYGVVTGLYKEHRAIVDQIVNGANAFSTAVENKADGTIARLTYVMAAVLLVLLAIVAIGITAIRRSVVKPILKLTDTLSTIASGDTGVEVPYIQRHDEIGTIAKATLSLRDSLIENTRQQSAAAERDRRAIEERAEQDRLMTEQKLETDRRTAQEREAATAAVMAELDAAVGGIVKAAMDGDFSQRVSLDGKEGTIRNLAESLNTMCENIGIALDEIGHMMTALSNGDLTRRITASYNGSFALLKDNANKTAERISATVSDIKAAAREVTSASMEITASTTDLSQRTEEQAASLEETSASMEEMAATVKKNADNAQQANQSAAGTRDVANRGGEVVAQAVNAMARIEESSRNISEIIGVIDEIARQTNLLALNAAVEAARAGDAGRGFAVVASEVRSLAQRSSQAAKDIKDLIVNSGGQVKEGVDLVNRAGNALTEITQSIKQVADLVSDIAAASAEQSAGIEQVNKALTQMDEVTQQNSALVEENAATAKTLEQQARAMDERIAFFRIAEVAVGGGAPRAAMAQPTPAVSMPKEKPVAAPAAVHGGGARPRANPVARMQNAIAAAWKDF